VKRALLATLLTVGATLTGTVTAQAAPAGRQALNWQPCQENATVQCATITVPIDYARPSTGAIQVAVARRPARPAASASCSTCRAAPADPG